MHSNSWDGPRCRRSSKLCLHLLNAGRNSRVPCQHRAIIVTICCRPFSGKFRPLQPENKHNVSQHILEEAFVPASRIAQRGPKPAPELDATSEADSIAISTQSVCTIDAFSLEACHPFLLGVNDVTKYTRIASTIFVSTFLRKPGTS